MSDLRALAEAATPGPWVMQDNGAGSVYVDSHAFEEGPEPVAGLVSMSRPDARYISAIDPTTLLALLDEVDALRAALEAVVEDTPCRFDHHGGCQEHGYLEPEDPWSPCPVAEAQRLVGLLEQEPVYDRRPPRAALASARAGAGEGDRV